MFWKKFTLLGEMFLFIPVFVLVFLVSLNPIQNYGKLSYLVDFFYHYFSFFPKWFIFIGFFLFFIILIIEIIGAVVKYFFFKPRPNPMKYTNWYEKVLAGSFPSLHSARTFTLFLIALIFTNYYIAGFFFIFWLLIAYSRVYLKKHYVIDIIGGVILSVAVFILFSKFLNIGIGF